jgi:hypothetical protein
MPRGALPADEARRFAESWLPARSGKRPELLASFPLADGFLNERRAFVPAGDAKVGIDGVCTFQLRAGLSYRSEVFFDRSERLAALASRRGARGDRG